MPPVFKINSAETSPENFPVTKARIIRRSAACDELAISVVPTAQIPQIGDTIEVFVGQTRKFAGRILKIPVSKSAQKSEIEIIAKNAWSYLEETVYQQTWTRAVNGTPSAILRSRVSLGQNSAGEKISVGEQLEEILAYAVSCGAQFAIGTIDIDSPMLIDEACDLSCAQAVAKVLKWSPNSSVYFDYDCDGLPRINIKKRSALDSAQINISQLGVISANVTARPDLKVDGVSVKYEQEHSENNSTWLSVSEEKYPPAINSNAPRNIVMTVDLDGLKARSSSYKIVCETIQPDSPQWWRKHVPALYEAGEITVLEYARSDDTYSRELVEGSIVSGMNFKTVKDRIKAKIRYEKNDGTIVSKEIAANVLSTNAASGTYTVWRTSQMAEEKPVGLAQAIYEAASALQHEGSLKLVDSLSETYFGKNINIVDLENPDWASVNAAVFYTEENLLESVTNIKFGPPKHLYPDNIDELFRINRNRKVSEDSTTRTSAKISPQEADLSQSKAEINGSEGDCAYERLVISDSENAQPQNKGIDLCVGDLAQNDNAKFREIYLCCNGHPATAKVLMTAPQIQNQ